MPPFTTEIRGNRILVCMPGGRSWILAHETRPTPEPFHTGTAHRRPAGNENAILSVTDFANEVTHDIRNLHDPIPGEGYPANRDNPVLFALKSAAWTLLAHILPGCDPSPLTTGAHYESLLLADPGYPDPGPHVVRLGEHRATPVPRLPDDRPPLIVNHTALVRGDVPNSPRTSPATMHSIYALQNELPFTLVRDTPAFSHYPWYHGLPRLAGVLFPRYGDRTRQRKSITAHLAISQAARSADSGCGPAERLYRSVRLPWCLRSEDVLWVTPDSAPTTDRLAAILHAAHEDASTAYNYIPQEAELVLAQATTLLAAAGFPPSPEQLRSTADGIRDFARTRLPPGYTVEIAIVPETA